MPRFVLTLGVAVIVAAAAGTVGGASGAGLAACTPGYSPCLPRAADIDCAQVPEAKRPVRVRGEDPYRLDRDGDGLGCEIAGEGGGAASPWGLIIQATPRKQAQSVRVGQRVLLTGWSPSRFAGQSFELCFPARTPARCDAGKTRLTGRVQRFGTHVVRSSDVRAGRFVAILLVGTVRATDRVPTG